ncbi:MAG: ligase-associated damage response exonuclease [Hydrocarboniphaga sp.]|uniref:ligase-associated DNA damage response exonuclease n=1 Tax=Hydrocarboniphaga sp. TaxID=2033016 RepID=UPI002636D240|nr:ligase-associated DNA damage response exonuclease [Hydrocarboniphaga sp.]MDB5968854.1 ligase-associated damage response exonuclease [Hydrocarboniphaga sp.]
MDLVVPTDKGLYCPAGDFHIDPSRPVERAVITHGHGDHARSGSKRYWGAAPGLGLLRERIGYGAGIVPLAYGQCVDFGPTRVSLHPAGHVLGSAQVRIEHDNRVWVVSGDYKRDPDPSCAPFEVVRCDVFVTEATFGLPVYRWQPTSEIAQEIFDWWQDCKAQGLCAILHCYALGKAQRILAELMRHSHETVYLHGSMTKLVKLYRDAGVAMLPTDAVGNQPKFFDWRGRLLLAPPGAGGTPWMRRFRPHSTALASGWMQAQNSSRRQAYDRGFALSDHADWPSLLRTIQETGAARVLAMHGNTEALVAWCHEQGIAAAPLQTHVNT